MTIYSVLRFINNHPICAGQRVSSLVRFFRWQLATRTLNLPVIIPFVNDTRLMAERGITCGAGSYYVGLLEYEEMAFTLHYLRPEDLFIDVGANIGTFTVLAAGAVGALCVSIEPIPQTYQRLLDNVNINDLNDRVLTINAGLGEKTSELKFTLDRDSINHVVTETETTCKTVDVKIVTLDSIVQDRMPELIKIDVEGFETQVVGGGADTLGTKDGPNAILMELRGHGARYGFSEEDVHKKMLGYGYEPYVYDPRNRELDAWRRKTENELGDMLYIRDVEKAKHRINEAPSFCVVGHTI